MPSLFLTLLAVALISFQATEQERDYIDALATRYNGDLSSPRAPLDSAYVVAMRTLHHKYPDDDDAAALFAESMMNTMPWDYWVDPENPKPLTVEALKRQGKDAGEYQERFDNIWARADVTLTASF